MKIIETQKQSNIQKNPNIIHGLRVVEVCHLKLVKTNNNYYSWVTSKSDSIDGLTKAEAIAIGKWTYLIDKEEILSAMTMLYALHHNAAFFCKSGKFQYTV